MTIQKDYSDLSMDYNILIDVLFHVSKDTIEMDDYFVEKYINQINLSDNLRVNYVRCVLKALEKESSEKIWVGIRDHNAKKWRKAHEQRSYAEENKNQ